MSISKKSELCIKCQKCCKHLIFILPIEKWYGMSDFYRARGCGIKYSGDKKHVAIMVSSVCQNLDPIIGCKIYDKRPKLCRDYDGRQDVFLKDECLWKELGDV